MKTDKNLHDIFIKHAKPIIESARVQNMNEYFHHGETSCLSHSIAVAFTSLKIVDSLNIKCDKESLIRGALLHDYFLYDWHESDKSHRLHGFTHAKTSLKNANVDFDLNHIEKDIIKKHMFPLNIIPPKYKESLIVCMADKLCAIYEVFSVEQHSDLPELC